MIHGLLCFVFLVKQHLMVGASGRAKLLIFQARKPREGKETGVPQSLPRVLTWRGATQSHSSRVPFSPNITSWWPSFQSLALSMMAFNIKIIAGYYTAMWIRSRVFKYLISTISEKRVDNFPNQYILEEVIIRLYFPSYFLSGCHIIVLH